MKLQLLSHLVIFLLFIFKTNQDVYDLVKLNTTTALCLDGSPTGYY